MIFDIVKRDVEKARSARHRRLIVLVGRDDRRLAEAAGEALRGYEAAGGRGTGLYMFQPEFADANKRMNYLRDLIEGSSLEVEFRPYKDTPRILGTTYDFAVLDLVNDLKPNDVGRLGGVVRGGRHIRLFSAAVRRVEEIHHEIPSHTASSPVHA